VIGKIALAASMMLLAVALVFLARAPEPQAATGSFYAEYLRVQPRGIPDEAARAQLQPLLSARLSALLKDGEDAEARYREASKGDVPPLVEGDVFTSLFEGATAYRVRDCKGDDATRLCPVSLSYRRRGEPETRWVDAVALVRETGGWRVDDIIYGGNWDFAKRGRLTEVLKNAIVESKKPVG
jgi:hypothetical protein